MAEAAKRDLLRDAIARNSAAVVSLPSAGMLRHHKSRFLSECADGFWVESVPAERVLVDALVASEEPVGVSFKSGHTKVVFTSPVSRRDPEYRINAETVVEAILLPFPPEVKAIQRRSNYRVGVRGDSALSVRIWRIAEHTYLKDRPMAVQEVNCEVRDISLGGLGVTFKGEDGQPPKVSQADRLRISLSYNEISLLMEGRMRAPHGQQDKDLIRAGVQFKKLENDLEGRQNLAHLTRIVGELQREEVRRHRLGVA